MLMLWTGQSHAHAVDWPILCSYRGLANLCSCHGLAKFVVVTYIGLLSCSFQNWIKIYPLSGLSSPENSPVYKMAVINTM